MPLPREESRRDTPSPSHQQSFTTCPPDDTRELIASDAPAQPSSDASPSAETASPDDQHPEHSDGTVERETVMAPNSESATTPQFAEDPQPAQRSGLGAKHPESREEQSEASSSPAASSDLSSESDSRATVPTPSIAKQSTQPSPQYLHFPKSDRERYTPLETTTSFLRPGSKFEGTQKSDQRIYNVQVEIKHVNMAESFLCGYLRIQGLTDEHPSLTTFFEGEIIGPKYLFKTTNPTWGSSEKVDYQHWNRFPSWRPLAKSAKSPNFSLKNFDQHEHLFMRWKEYFLVPDHRVKTISGASFEGFYYICFNQCSGKVSGIYFHAKSEKYQQLDLEHVSDQGCVAAMEFR